MNRRNTVLALLSLGVAPLAARAQQPVKPARIAWLGFSNPEAGGFALNAFKRGLRELDYLEGKNFVLDTRWALLKAERLPDLANELVALHPDVILVSAPVPTRAAQQATTTIPIVMVAVGDPVGAGFVKSLARPGGNITGFSDLTAELSPKLLELLLATVPKLSRVAVLWNPSGPANTATLKSVQTAARGVNLNIFPMEAQTPAEIESAFLNITEARAGALMVLSDVFLYFQSRRIAELALNYRMPSIFAYRAAVASGGLMSYGPDLTDPFRRAATYVDKILKGTKPGDLPVEQPTKFELVINRKTANSLRLTIPQELLLRADEVIE